MVMKSVRFQFAGLFAGLAAFSLLATVTAQAQGTASAPAAANKPVQPSETKEFGDWTVRCYPVASATPCEMIELLVNKKSGRRVLGVLVIYNQAQNQSLMQIALPLGVMLQNGAVLSSDTYTSGVLHYRICDMQGCYALAPLGNDAIESLGRATKAEMKIVSVDGKKFNIAFSLNGFTAAHSALLELTRKKSSGASLPAGTPSPEPAQ
jgi:invasion protein IalB